MHREEVRHDIRSRGEAKVHEYGHNEEGDEGKTPVGLGRVRKEEEERAERCGDGGVEEDPCGFCCAH